MGVTVLDYKVGVLNDYELRINVPDGTNPNIAYANIQAKVGALVYGLVVEINEKDEWILDRYENFPIDYLKTKVKVCLKGKTSCEASVYIGNPTHIINNNLCLNEEQYGRILWGITLIEKKTNTAYPDKIILKRCN